MAPSWLLGSLLLKKMVVALSPKEEEGKREGNDVGQLRGDLAASEEKRSGLSSLGSRPLTGPASWKCLLNLAMSSGVRGGLRAEAWLLLLLEKED